MVCETIDNNSLASPDDTVASIVDSLNFCRSYRSSTAAAEEQGYQVDNYLFVTPNNQDKKKSNNKRKVHSDNAGKKLASLKLDELSFATFAANVESRARELSTRVVLINLVSLAVNLLLAATAFYFAFKNDSSATSAFAADCTLDAISSAIVLWRFHGDLSSVYLDAREQIACIYLGVLFEISALGITIEAINGLLTGKQQHQLLLHSNSYGLQVKTNYVLIYLASSAAVAMSILTILKYILFRTLKDNAILLDVVNTFISALFAVSIIMSQYLINANPSLWYLDPILSVALAVFMALFGLRVIHENFNILKPQSTQTTTHAIPTTTEITSSPNNSNNNNNLLDSNGNNLTITNNANNEQEYDCNHTFDNLTNKHHIFDSVSITMPPEKQIQTLEAQRAKNNSTKNKMIKKKENNEEEIINSSHHILNNNKKKLFVNYSTIN